MHFNKTVECAYLIAPVLIVLKRSILGWGSTILHKLARDSDWYSFSNSCRLSNLLDFTNLKNLRVCLLLRFFLPVLNFTQSP